MENKANGIEFIGASESVKAILASAPKDSGIDEGMVEEEYKHRQLLLLAYIATQLEKLNEK